MNLKRTVIFVAVVLAVGLSAHALSFGAGIGKYDIIPVKDAIKYGLDLRGGVYVVLEAKPGEGETITGGLLDRAMATIRNRVDALGVSEPVITKQGENRIRVELPDITDSERAVELIGRTAQLKFLDPDGNEVLTGQNVRNAEAVYQTGSSGVKQAVVSLELDSEGATGFADVTGSIMEIPNTSMYQPERAISIVLDGEVISAPEVMAHITNGKAVIDGMADIQTAAELATLIKAGALPVDLEAVEIRAVGPTLGANSLEKSVRAGLIGILLVMLFMAAYYRIPGLIADLSLIIYMMIVLLVLVSINAALTLPGVAGLLLSIGMAVDANVIIFERLKEELKNGKSLRPAVDAGFKRAFTTILDSNVTTLLAAAVLFYLGAGPIQGFAVTLAIGIIASMFTAIVVTKALLKLIIGTNIVKNTKLFGA